MATFIYVRCYSHSNVGAETSAQVWKTLEVYFVTQTSAKIDFYTTQLQNYKKGPLSVNEYLLQIKTLVDKLGSFGHRVSIKEHVAEIFKGLPLIYDTFVISVNSRNDQYLIVEIETLLLSQEHKMESHNKDLDSVNLATQCGFIPKPQCAPQFSHNANNNIPNQGHGLWNPYAVSSRVGAANVNKKSINVATTDKVTDEA